MRDGWGLCDRLLSHFGRCFEADQKATRQHNRLKPKTLRELPWHTRSAGTRNALGSEQPETAGGLYKSGQARVPIWASLRYNVAWTGNSVPTYVGMRKFSRKPKFPLSRKHIPTLLTPGGRKEGNHAITLQGFWGFWFWLRHSSSVRVAEGAGLRSSGRGGAPSRGAPSSPSPARPPLPRAPKPRRRDVRGETEPIGGVLGRKVELLIRDSGASPEKAISLAKQLIDEEKSWPILARRPAERASNQEHLSGRPTILCLVPPRGDRHSAGQHVFKPRRRDSRPSGLHHAEGSGITKIGVITSNTAWQRREGPLRRWPRKRRRGSVNEVYEKSPQT